MPTRSLRILIADHSHLQRLGIEKMLNHCGYHRVAPISSFKELLLIVDNAHEPFDLLVINSAFGGTVALDLEAFCRDCTRVHHALIYDGPPMSVALPKRKPPARVIKKLPGVPDTDAIKKVMVEIDPEKPVRSPHFSRTPSR